MTSPPILGFLINVCLSAVVDMLQSRNSYECQYSLLIRSTTPASIIILKCIMVLRRTKYLYRCGAHKVCKLGAYKYILTALHNKMKNKKNSNYNFYR